MILRKIVLGSAAFLAGALLSAQNLSLHGWLAYDFYPLGQRIFQLDEDADWDHTEASAEYGTFYNGGSGLSAVGGVGPVSFDCGIRFDSALGEWYNLFHDMSAEGNNPTMFDHAFLRISMLQDQLVLHTGKYDGWNCGMIRTGSVFDAQSITDIAMRDQGQHITGLEWIPNMNVFDGALVGFRIFAGLPLLPPGKTYDWTKANGWDVLWRKAKIMAQYTWLRQNMTFVAGYHNEYYTGTDNDWAYSEDFTKSFYREAFVQVDMPTLIPIAKLLLSYDVRWRTAETSYMAEDGSTVDWEKVCSAHYIGLSATSDAIMGWPINVENRFYFADDHYVGINEKTIMECLGVSVAHKIAGTPYRFGATLIGKYAQDANGSSFDSDGWAPKNESHAGGLMDFHNTWMGGPDNITTKGDPTKYATVYFNPYFAKDFGNGNFTIGLEVQYMGAFNDSIKSHDINYRVPVGFFFWF